MGQPWGKLMSDLHQAAQTDLPAIRGVWRMQEEFFGSRPWSGRIERG
jgi:hypothetical protein